MPSESASSAAFNVTTSLSFAHFKILVREVSCGNTKGRMEWSLISFLPARICDGPR